MDAATIQRYQPGGDIYASLAASYGTPGAQQVATAALTGDETQVNAALTQVKYGAPLNTSTAEIFGTQLATDPLGAPLADLNTALGNTFFSFLKNPWVLITIAALVFFFVFDGVNILRRQFK
jgi:hypothetical protein